MGSNEDSGEFFGTCKCNCGSVTFLNKKVFEDYFDSQSYQCEDCGKKLWDMLMDRLGRVDLILGWHYGILGCISGSKCIELEADGEYIWNVSDSISDGELLNLWLLNANQSIKPLIQLGAIPQHPFKSKKISIYGRSLRSVDPHVDKIKLQLRYVYAPKKVRKDLGTMLLLDAFKFFQESNYRYMIISAHTSVEILLNDFIETSLLNNGVSKKKTEEFLSQAATYSYQLKALLPFITKMRGLPKLDQKIYASLEHLRKDRNELIHRGKTDMSNIERLKNELISAFFAHQYFRIHKKTR